MLKPSHFSRVERKILASCHLDEWPSRVWFPRPFRDSLNLPDNLTDGEILDALVSLVRRGFVHVGRISQDGHFSPELLIDQLLAEIIDKKDPEFWFSAREDTYEAIKNEPWHSP